MLQNVIRAFILLVGLCIGAVVYSYGMFHRLAPTSSDIVAVAHCGVLPSSGVQANDKAAFEGDSAYFCQIAPGKWVKTPYGVGPLFLALGITLMSALAALYRSSFLRWATRSARGLITLLLLLFGIPMMLLGLQWNFIEGTLTLDGALHSAFAAVLAGSVMGLFFWFTVVRNFSSNRRST